ncbi:MltA domain-containing protein [Methylocystis sp.]|uniref:murein transglycosylase A n=1 Tax=Methylocystis sp. TaxID=1911079 RepID=UPI0025DFC8D6|nr:MltA domain-containing protein [Methylocystis sp.]
MSRKDAPHFLASDLQQSIGFDEIDGFFADDLAAAFEAFRRSAKIIAADAQEQRSAVPPPPSLILAARAARASVDDAADFFRRWFHPRLIKAQGFVTAYYEVEVDARLSPEPGFTTPVLSRPLDLVTLNEAPLVLPSREKLTSARRQADGALVPYPDRRAIEEEGAAPSAHPLAYVRDPVELFLIQVQGSARLRLRDGGVMALTYAGRNGWPYTSVGRLLVERGLATKTEMSLDIMKETLRRLGAGPGEAGRRLMQENRSYVFFEIDGSEQRRIGPIGGQGAPLTPFRSIAVDRSIWCYGLPFWIAARIPWQDRAETEFRRLMIAQDTGSAIIGPARADLFFGAGEAAGRRAGDIRHAAQMFVLLPKDVGDDP